VGLASAFPSAPCTDNTKRFCKNGVFNLDFDYEFMEGNVPLGMLAAFFIETSTTSSN
jgi:hypothetical protein